MTHEIQLLTPDARNAARVLVEEELSHVKIMSREFYRTRAHSADGLRLYAPMASLWPYRETLGWCGPDGTVVESDYYKAGAGYWEVAVAGRGHVVRLAVDARELAGRGHLKRLDAVAARLLRAWWPRAAECRGR